MLAILMCLFWVNLVIYQSLKQTLCVSSLIVAILGSISN